LKFGADRPNFLRVGKEYPIRAFVGSSRVWSFGDSFSGLESTLEITSIREPGATLDAETFDRTKSAVFACDLTIPASPSGRIFSVGGWVYGTFVGFRPDGSFVVRSVDGSVASPTVATDRCSVVFTNTNQPSGAGTLVWEYNMTLRRVRAWWNGLEIATPQPAILDWEMNEVAGGLWAGIAGGSYLESSSDFGGEPNFGLPASNPSFLRYYENQLISG
jgi:hypothetical protein